MIIEVLEVLKKNGSVVEEWRLGREILLLIIIGKSWKIIREEMLIKMIEEILKLIIGKEGEVKKEDE